MKNTKKIDFFKILKCTSTLRMKEGRWPQIRLREEVRGILNKNPLKWGAEFMKAMREVGDDRILDLIWAGS